MVFFFFFSSKKMHFFFTDLTSMKYNFHSRNKILNLIVVINKWVSRNTLSCSVLSLSFRFSIWTKYPQNLLVSLWIVDHRLHKESLERLNFLSLWKVDQILSQNVVCFWSVDVTASKLTLSHADTSLMSSSTMKLAPCWLLLVVDVFAMGEGGRLSHFNFGWRLMDIHV